jgi:predicted dehydrogenase
MPRVGFLGAGWIGRNRMSGFAAANVGHIVAVADTASEAARAAARDTGAQWTLSSLDELLALDLDGIVIATPSALHASQTTAALESGCAVFCQKPLGRNAREAEATVAAARRVNRLLDVDFSYRFADGLQKIHALIASGALGQIYAADLTFHNAYGPDKPWFYDRVLSGGGCVVDLGVHLVDLALWMVGDGVVNVTSRLFSNGQPWSANASAVEDFAVMRLDFANGATAQLACSWRLPAGRDAVIEATFYGTKGAARWRNVNGSFYDFLAERLDGTNTTVISEPPDAWGPRAIVRWGERLRDDGRFDADVERVIEVSAIVDQVYGTWPIDEGREYRLSSAIGHLP